MISLSFRDRETPASVKLAVLAQRSRWRLCFVLLMHKVLPEIVTSRIKFLQKLVSSILFWICHIFYLISSSFSLPQMTVNAAKQKENQVITANRGTENSPDGYK